MTYSFEADLAPDTLQPRIRFNFDNGWSASLLIRTSPTAKDKERQCSAIMGATAAAPTGQWGEGKTELGSQEASADEVAAFLYNIMIRPHTPERDAEIMQGAM